MSPKVLKNLTLTKTKSTKQEERALDSKGSSKMKKKTSCVEVDLEEVAEGVSKKKSNALVWKKILLRLWKEQAR